MIQDNIQGVQDLLFKSLNVRFLTQILNGIYHIIKYAITKTAMISFITPFFTDGISFHLFQKSAGRMKFFFLKLISGYIRLLEI